MASFFSNGSSFTSVNGVGVVSHVGVMHSGGGGRKIYEDRDGEVFTGSNMTCRRVRNCTITGSNAKVDDAVNCVITGSNARVTKAKGCRVVGSNAYVEGDDNQVNGTNAEVVGKNNQVIGDYATNNGEPAASTSSYDNGMVVSGSDISTYSDGNYTKTVCNGYTVETWFANGKTHRRVTYPDGHMEQKEYDGAPPPIFF